MQLAPVPYWRGGRCGGRAPLDRRAPGRNGGRPCASRSLSRTKVLVAMSWPLARISRQTTMARPARPTTHSSVQRTLGDSGWPRMPCQLRRMSDALVQGPLARMQADHGAGRRPELLHGLVVAVVEGAIEGAVGRQHGIALVVVEFRHHRRQAGRTARHSTLETPLLRGLGLADTEEASNRREGQCPYPSSSSRRFICRRKPRSCASRSALSSTRRCPR